MKIILSLEAPDEMENVEKYLVDSLFEVCEEWVLRGQQPDLEIVKGN